MVFPNLLHLLFFSFSPVDSYRRWLWQHFINAPQSITDTVSAGMLQFSDPYMICIWFTICRFFKQFVNLWSWNLKLTFFLLVIVWMLISWLNLSCPVVFQSFSMYLSTWAFVKTRDYRHIWCINRHELGMALEESYFVYDLRFYHFERTTNCSAKVLISSLIIWLLAYCLLLDIKPFVPLPYSFNFWER